MNKIIGFFEKYGIAKIVCSFFLLALFAWLFNTTDISVFKYLAIVPAAYIASAFLLFLVAGICNSFHR